MSAYNQQQKICGPVKEIQFRVTTVKFGFRNSLDKGYTVSKSSRSPPQQMSDSNRIRDDTLNITIRCYNWKVTARISIKVFVQKWFNGSGPRINLGWLNHPKNPESEKSRFLSFYKVEGKQKRSVQEVGSRRVKLEKVI